MFEVGGEYWITMLDGGVENSSTWTVKAYDHPLIKVARGDELQIINTASQLFIRAKAK